MPDSPVFWFDWSSLIIFSGMLNTAFAFYVAVKQYKMLNKPTSLLWLILLLGCIWIILAEELLRYSSLLGHFPRFLFISSPFLFVYLPLILLYNYAILEQRVKAVYHFVLPLCMLVLMIPTYLTPGRQKLETLLQKDSADPVWVIMIYLAYCVYYLVRIFKTERQLRKRLKDESADDKIEYYTLANRIISKVSLLAFVFPLSLLLQYVSLPAEHYHLIQKLLYVVFSASGHLILFSLLINRSSLSYGVALETGPGEVPVNVATDELAIKKQELLQAISTQQYYLQRDLTLNSLAQELGWSRTSLSYVINAGFGQNFYDFVNTFRIETFEKRLREKAHHQFSLDHLAMECGFSNYTSFYRIFKRLRNETPSAFIKSLNG